MSLVVPLTPKEEARLSVAAKERGLAPAELVKRIVAEYLPSENMITTQTLDAKLRDWQKQDNSVLMPEVSTQTLFAQWAAEDALMTDAEHHAEEELWAGIEQRLVANNPVLALRRL